MGEGNSLAKVLTCTVLNSTLLPSAFAIITLIWGFCANLEMCCRQTPHSIGAPVELGAYDYDDFADFAVAMQQSVVYRGTFSSDA